MSKTKTKKQKYGWKPDLPDHRDFYLSLPPVTQKELPSKVDLRETDIEIFSQGQLGSCTANAISAAYAFDIKKQGKNLFIPSRLFIYYNERDMEDNVDYDSGAMLRDGIKTLNKDGVCDEVLWPYLIDKFRIKPPKRCYKEAEQNKIVLYQRVNRTLYDLKNCLASGLPFVIGFMVYENFESQEVGRTGMMSLPNQSEKPLGGHAVMVIGYDDNLEGGRFIVRNSWGKEWGDKGYFYMPYDYLTNSNLSDDFWVIQKVS